MNKLISPTLISSAPPTPLDWKIPPTPPRGEIRDEGIEAVECNRCQNQFSSNAVLGLHECIAQPSAKKRKRGRPKKQRIEESPIDVSGVESENITDKEILETQRSDVNSSGSQN